MHLIRGAAALLARILLSAVFIASSVNKIIYWKETEKRFLSVLSDWQTYLSSSEGAQVFLGWAMVWAPVILMAATFVELLGALFLLFGFREKLGAALLILVLIPTTVLLQHFWFGGSELSELQLTVFLRDLAILGGLIVVLLHGAKGGSSGDDYASGALG